MAVTVKLRHLRIAPRKVREVIDIVRGKRVERAQALLGFARRGAAGPIRKLLSSAIASAENDFSLQRATLFISKIFVDEGPMLKRWRPGSRGSALPVKKRTSHITLVLDTVEKKAEPPKKAVKKAKPVREKPAKEEKKEEEIEQKKTESIGRQRPRKKAFSLIPKRRGVKKRVFKRKAF